SPTCPPSPGAPAPAWSSGTRSPPDYSPGRAWLLLDHLVGASDDGLRDRKAEGLGGLEVDHQLELGRLLDGQVGGLRAFQDLVHVNGRAAERVGTAGSIGHEAASVDVLPLCIHGRQPILL